MPLLPCLIKQLMPWLDAAGLSLHPHPYPCASQNLLLCQILHLPGLLLSHPLFFHAVFIPCRCHLDVDSSGHTPAKHDVMSDDRATGTGCSMSRINHLLVRCADSGMNLVPLALLPYQSTQLPPAEGPLNYTYDIGSTLCHPPQALLAPTI